MSASNWAVCPRCKARREGDLRLREAEVSAAYGAVSVEEFDAMRTKLAEDRAVPMEHTFREDYEIYGAADGEVHVEYGGGCGKCGLSLSFRHDHALYSEEAAK